MLEVRFIARPFVHREGETVQSPSHILDLVGIDGVGNFLVDVIELGGWLEVDVVELVHVNPAIKRRNARNVSAVLGLCQIRILDVVIFHPSIDVMRYIGLPESGCVDRVIGHLEGVPGDVQFPELPDIEIVECLVDSDLDTAVHGISDPEGDGEEICLGHTDIGDVGKDGVKVKVNEKLYLVPEKYKLSVDKKTKVIPNQYTNLYKDVKVGASILIDDAKIELKVLKIKGKALYCKVVIGEVINTHKGMNFPKSSISTPAITAKDKVDLEFGIKQNVDFVALSFVKNAADIIRLRKMIHQLEKKLKRKVAPLKNPKRQGNWPNTSTKIIAKIERPEAVADFTNILDAVDGIMVARGDLGLEIPIQDLPLTQKKIIRSCIKKSKPVIVATQMLDSMIRYPVPTRAEVSDVANAILDGADAIMLSGETATGKYPLKAVQVMARIADSVEQHEIDKYELLEEGLKKQGDVTENVSFAAQDIAEDIQAKFIVCATTSGFTARSVAKYRPQVQSVAIATTEKVRNQLCLSWGVQPYHFDFTSSFVQLTIKIKKFLLSEKLVKKGDIVVIAAGHPFGHLSQTNLIKVEKI